MNTARESEALLHALCADADPRKVRSLRLIHAICVEQRDRGSDDYSIATIGRLSAERGGPAAGAIRNKTGETYRALIKVFADAVVGNARKGNDAAGSQIDIILEGVTDPMLRARLGLLLAELKATRAQLLAARHLANQTTTLDLVDPSSHGLPSPTANDLTPLEIRALENAISQETMDHWRWHTDESGRITTDAGRTIFSAGFVTAIQKTLANSTPSRSVAIAPALGSKAPSP